MKKISNIPWGLIVVIAFFVVILLGHRGNTNMLGGAAVITIAYIIVWFYLKRDEKKEKEKAEELKEQEQQKQLEEKYKIDFSIYELEAMKIIRETATKENMDNFLNDKDFKFHGITNEMLKWFYWADAKPRTPAVLIGMAINKHKGRDLVNELYRIRSIGQTMMVDKHTE